MVTVDGRGPRVGRTCCQAPHGSNGMPAGLAFPQELRHTVPVDRRRDVPAAVLVVDDLDVGAVHRHLVAVADDAADAGRVALVPLEVQAVDDSARPSHQGDQSRAGDAVPVVPARES